MAKSFFETIIASGGFAGESFDVAAGPANTAVIDTLLSAGNGTLTIDAPFSLTVTGALGAPRDLFLYNLEQDGRFFVISVRATDIATNPLTLMVTTDINGFGPTSGLTISSPQDYLVVHESGGVWRAYQQKLSQGLDAQVYRATFTATDWSSGVKNQITFIQSGTPTAGQLGPHGLAISSSYTVSVYRDSDNELVDVGIVVDPITGDVTLTKTGLGADFAGRVMITGTV